MNLRQLTASLESGGRLAHVTREVSPEIEMAAVMATMDERPVRFERVAGSPYSVVGGLCSSRELVAAALSTTEDELLPTMVKALRRPAPNTVVSDGPCREVVERTVDLRTLPAMRYLPRDGGRYIPSAVAVVRDPQAGVQNACFHRLMVLDRHRVVARIVEGRGTDTALRKSPGGTLDVALVIGSSTAVMLAAATSLPHGVDELALANALERTDLVQCSTSDLLVPAESEIVLEGIITAELQPEGPFLDLTGTYDRVRAQRVIEIRAITHRHDAVYQTLLPGLREHRLLMGMPREPTILLEVSKICRCLDVSLTPGGCSWLHAVVQIQKEHADDGPKALAAAFRGHGSLKHCVVVDEDIDVRDPRAVEWAVATRFQGDRDAAIMAGQPGSSLDPSAELRDGRKAATCKVGIDATVPWDRPRESFTAETYGTVDLGEYL
jgi:2,5-furandicarboxylate decarboxylase 1